jgi:hypothetical protein
LKIDLTTADPPVSLGDHDLSKAIGRLLGLDGVFSVALQNLVSVNFFVLYAEYNILDRSMNTCVNVAICLRGRLAVLFD